MPGATELYCRVRTPKGFSLTARADARQAVVSPVDCGYFPDTLVRGGRPLEAIVCVSAPGSPGGRIAVKPVSLLRTRDRHGYHHLVLCVPRDDPSWSRVDSIHDLSPRMRREIERFITRLPPEGATEVIAWCSQEDAMTAIDDAAARWAATVNGRG
jgi:inorganic pyrophosphatase